MKVLAVSKRTLILFLLTICLIGYLNVGCSADLAYYMSIDEMTEKADVILVGKVESVSHYPADPNDVPRMHRRVLVSVERDLKNPVYSSNVTILVLGATIGNTTLWVEDQPEFNVSERVLLFLREDPWFLEENPNGYYQVLGECQGKFTVEGESAISELGLVVHDGDEFHGIKFALEAATSPLPPILSDLTITPDEVERGDNVTIGLDIENIDSQSFTYIVTMHIENVNDPPTTWPPYNATLTIYVELEAYESKTVSQTLTHETAGYYNVIVDRLMGSFEVKEPKKPETVRFIFNPFEVIVNDFQVHPLAIEVEDEDDVWTFRISYNVTNVGDCYWNYSVRSKIDGTVVDSNVFFLEAGETQSYLFEVERGVGKYEVEVEEFTESIEVKLIPMGQIYNPKTISYGTILLGLIAVIIILWYARARKL